MLIDAHTHLDHYTADPLDAALVEIAQQQIFSIGVSMDLPSYRRNLEIARRCELVLPTFGIHPMKAAGYAHRLDDLRAALRQTPMIGEIGLDYHWVEDKSTYPAQRTVFEFCLAAAQEQGKAVNLHTKGAEEEILSLLRRYDIRRAIVHWYSGPLDTFKKLADWGAWFTVGVEIHHSDLIRTIARSVPAAQLLTETDNPGGEEWLTGRVGMPHLVGGVVQALADLRGTTPDDIAATVHANFARLIQDDAWMAETHRRFFSSD